MADPNQEAQAQEAAAAETMELSDFESLLQKEFKPKTDQRREEIEGAVRTLAEQALSATQLVSDDAVRSIEAIVKSGRWVGTSSRRRGTVSEAMDSASRRVPGKSPLCQWLNAHSTSALARATLASGTTLVR